MRSCLRRYPSFQYCSISSLVRTPSRYGWRHCSSTDFVEGAATPLHMLTVHRDDAKGCSDPESGTAKSLVEPSSPLTVKPKSLACIALLLLTDYTLRPESRTQPSRSVR